MSGRVNYPTTKIGVKDPYTVMTDMQRMFVHYLVHERMKPAQAARAAGSQSRSVASWAAETMKKPHIKAAILEAQQEYRESVGMTRKKVMDGFLEAVDLARTKGEPMTMVTGWREIGRMCGYYEATKHKVEISVNGRVQLEKISGMTDEELMKMIEERQEPAREVLEGEFSTDEDSDTDD